ncbi:MAG: nuclear transport factor 2 family protein [Candidatus Binatia bacterium]
MTNVEFTQQLFAAFGRADVPAILDLVDDEIVIEFYGPTEIPYAGTWRGREEARCFFETVLASVDIRQFEPQEFLADRDKVVVTGHLLLVAKATGRTIESDFVHVITMRAGKWLRFRDFMNTAAAAAAFGR